MDRFRYLHYGLGAVLGFVGAEMVAREVGCRHKRRGKSCRTWVSLAVIVTLLAADDRGLASGKEN